MHRCNCFTTTIGDPETAVAVGATEFAGAAVVIISLLIGTEVTIGTLSVITVVLITELLVGAEVYAVKELHGVSAT